MSSWLFPPQTLEAQFDEKWSFVGKKEKHCDHTDPADDRCGDCWDYVALDPEHLLAIGPGRLAGRQLDATAPGVGDELVHDVERRRVLRHAHARADAEAVDRRRAVDERRDRVLVEPRAREDPDGRKAGRIQDLARGTVRRGLNDGGDAGGPATAAIAAGCAGVTPPRPRAPKRSSSPDRPAQPVCALLKNSCEATNPAITASSVDPACNAPT